jgi:hypothetical protein
LQLRGFVIVSLQTIDYRYCNKKKLAS